MTRSFMASALVGTVAVVLGCTDGVSIGGSDDGGRGAISGSIVNALTGVPVERDVAVNIRGAESHNLTAVRGSFGIGGLLPGGYSVTIQRPAGFEMVIGESATQNVQVTGATTRALTFRVRPVTTNQIPVPPQARD